MAKLSERDLVCAEVLVGNGKSVRSVVLPPVLKWTESPVGS